MPIKNPFTLIESSKYKIRILNKEEDKELYRKIQTKIAERFHGTENQAYKMSIHGIDIENVKGSQIIWNNLVNLYIPKKETVLNWEDLQKIYEVELNILIGKYAETTSLCLKTKIPSMKKNKKFLESLVKQIKGDFSEFKYFSKDNPIVISGMDFERDDDTENYYGLLPKLNEKTKIKYDQRLADDKEEIEIGKIKKRLRSKAEGMSKISADGNDYIDVDNSLLHNSDNTGFVIVIDKNKNPLSR